jgi:hypothetical protein
LETEDSVKPLPDEIPSTTHLFSNGFSTPKTPIRRVIDSAGGQWEVEASPSPIMKKQKRDFNGTSGTPTKVERRDLFVKSGQINSTSNMEVHTKVVANGDISQISKQIPEPKDQEKSLEVSQKGITLGQTPKKIEQETTKEVPKTPTPKISNGHSATNGPSKSKKESKDTKGPKESKESKEIKDSTELEVPQDSKELKESKDPKKPNGSTANGVEYVTKSSEEAAVVVWDESLVDEWTKEIAAEKTPKFDLTKRKKQIEVLQTLTGFSKAVGQYPAKGK